MGSQRSITPRKTPTAPGPPGSRKVTRDGRPLAPPSVALTPTGTIWLQPMTAMAIGRLADCDIVLDDPLVSRLHAFIIVGVDRVELEDVPSRNGTYLNGARISKAELLRSGDRIVIGTTEISVFQEYTAGHSDRS
jgi:hypothetical protein